MAGLTNSPRASTQFAAVLEMRWLAFLHSLRTRQGQLDLIARVVVAGMAASLALGGAFGLGAAAYYFASTQRLQALAFLLWPVLLFWQMFPALSTAFSGSVDSTSLVRFPLNFRSYYLIHVIEGSLAAGPLIPCLWTAGITLGIGLGKPNLFLPATLVLATFAAVNLLLSRMVMSWVERWMAQRRTREVFGVVFVLLMMSLQFFANAAGRQFEHRQHTPPAAAQYFKTVQKALPPGAATEALINVDQGRLQAAGAYTVVLAGYGMVFLLLLGIRLKAIYRGENLSEVKRRTEVVDRSIKLGWDMFGLPGPVASMFEKEIRYLLRSGQGLLSLISPVLVMVIFRFQGTNGNPFMRTSSIAFPVGAAFALLSVTNMLQNCFGGDGGGVQLLYAAPVRFRDVMLGKNLAHSAVFAFELVLVATTLAFLGRSPSAETAALTIVAAVFAILVQASIGNCLSLTLPKKVDFGRFNRQQASQAAVFISMATTAAIFGICALAVFVAHSFGTTWIAVALMCAMVCAAAFAYWQVLGRVDGIALSRREKVLAAVCRS